MPTDIVSTKWNIWVWNNYNKAKSLADKLYWEGLYV